VFLSLNKNKPLDKILFQYVHTVEHFMQQYILLDLHMKDNLYCYLVYVAIPVKLHFSYVHTVERAHTQFSIVCNIAHHCK